MLAPGAEDPRILSHPNNPRHSMGLPYLLTWTPETDLNVNIYILYIYILYIYILYIYSPSVWEATNKVA